MILHTQDTHTNSTDNKIKGLKPTEKRYSLSAGNGLSIDVMPTGRNQPTQCQTHQIPQNTKRLWSF